MLELEKGFLCLSTTEATYILWRTRRYLAPTTATSNFSATTGVAFKQLNKISLCQREMTCKICSKKAFVHLLQALSIEDSYSPSSTRRTALVADSHRSKECLIRLSHYGQRQTKLTSAVLKYGDLPQNNQQLGSKSRQITTRDRCRKLTCKNKVLCIR